jgi:hypothetical protein
MRRNDLLLLRYCKSSLRDLRKVVNKLSEDETVNSRRYLQSFHQRNNRNYLLDQITRILKEYNGVADTPFGTLYWIDEDVFFWVREFQLEMYILLTQLSLEIAAIEEEENFAQSQSKQDEKLRGSEGQGPAFLPNYFFRFFETKRQRISIFNLPFEIVLL